MIVLVQALDLTGAVWKNHAANNAHLKSAVSLLSVIVQDKMVISLNGRCTFKIICSAGYF